MSSAMTLPEFRKSRQLSQAKFAERMTAAGFPTTQALVSQWESGVVEISAERCCQIEVVTEGAVLRVDLRPDIFGPMAFPLADGEEAA